MTTRSLAIGIPVCNRRQLVEFNAFSVSRLVVPENLDLRILVIDDCSTEFGTDLLSSIYPEGTRILRRETPSGGADYAAADLLGHLVRERTDTVMILDSDCILRSDALITIVRSFSLTDGLLSLFNTDNHPAYQEVGGFVLKNSIGAAGTVWSGELAQDILANVLVGRRWDWRVGEYLRERGTRLFCLKNSALQHLGFSSGENSNLVQGDFGSGFSDQAIEYLYFITEEIVRAQKRGNQKLNERLTTIERFLSRAGK